MTGLERPFVSVHSRSTLEREVEMAEALMENGVNPFLEDVTPIEAYIEALKFVMNQQGSSVREDYEDLMDCH
ncbi:hypothetical protein C1S99_10765 [Vibrio parahaemolyticus]|uniref:hypothetical protein n=1 Tax=Vibrio parahaemolyticus TaxID=670 RepID=UPI000530CF1D|nr:hypothetical protein [Vibrio parahaemolyticus]EJB8688799.1 hypothetical protein [Vibrio parahaemolyticus]KGT35587.1 hypothetical protein HC02_04030 [Vibrio parahaemolyticus]MBE3899210.1 hypothetical protein [Vibrio parahaemolyticus]MDG2564397.1 hypothetical protein [Vibrio parahaemolyticus]PMS42190.1 hypothetical protein C1T12_11250 [Vibrio parahaemolyticus]